MARLYSSGAELGADHAEQLTAAGSGTATYDTGVFRSGSRSYKFDAGAGNAAIYKIFDFTGATSRSYYARAYLYLPAFPSATSSVLSIDVAGTTSILDVRITSAGDIEFCSTNAHTTLSSDSIATNTWYRVEIRGKIGAGATDEVQFLLDGAEEYFSTGLTITDTAPSRIRFGWEDAPGANKVLYVDDVALNDDTGTDQSGWPGDGQWVCLFPISDNNRGGWTGGSGGTTNLWDAVDNAPPTGTATETDTTQIESATNSASDPADFNMTSYSTAGLVAGDIIRLVTMSIVHGEDIATATKTGSFTIVSNPALGSTPTFTFGDDAGALGTYPTTWGQDSSSPLYHPAVTLGTSPVARVTKTTASTRVGSVAQMAIGVEYYRPPAVPGYTGTWTPANLSVTPRAYWFADDVPGIDGDTVSFWTDRTANAYTIIQATASLRPTLQTSELNSRNTVRFDGTDDYLTIASVLGITAQPVSIFAVWKVAASGQQTLMQAANDTIGYFKTSPNGELANLSGGFGLIQSGMSAAGWYITSGEHSGASGISAINGVTFSGNPGTNVPATSLNVGANRTPGDYLNGDIAVIIVAQTQWSTAERQMLEGWAAHVFGLTANLPSTHPFKLSPPRYPSLPRRALGNRAYLRR